MKWRRLSALLILLICPSVGQGGVLRPWPRRSGDSQRLCEGYLAVVRRPGPAQRLAGRHAFQDRRRMVNGQLYVSVRHRRLPLEHPGGGRPRTSSTEEKPRPGWAGRSRP